MKEILAILITILVTLSLTYPLHAQNHRGGAFASRGNSGGVNGARIGTTGSGSRAMLSNFRGRFSKAGSSSSLRGNTLRMNNRTVNSNLKQRGFGQNISNAGTSFSTSSNLTTSTLGRKLSNPKFQSFSNPRTNSTETVNVGPKGFGSNGTRTVRSRLRNDPFVDNSVTTSTLGRKPSNPKFQTFSNSRKYTAGNVNRGPKGIGSRRINNVRSNFQKDAFITKTNGSSPSSSNIRSPSRGLDRLTIIDKKAALISKNFNSNTEGIRKIRSLGKEDGIKSLNQISTSSVRNRNIAHWVDRNNGIKHFTNDINSIPQGAETITLVDGKNSASPSGGSIVERNITTSRSLDTGTSSSSPVRTANLVMEKAIEFPGQHPGIAVNQVHLRRNIHDANHTKGVHHNKGFNTVDRHHFHHQFHHGHFFPFNPFFFGNSFFFFRPFFPLSSFFFVSNPFLFQPIFPSPFFVFNPFIFVPVPVGFFPVFPQFTAFTPFINPFFINPFFNPFFFRTDFFFNTIAFNNFF